MFFSHNSAGDVFNPESWRHVLKGGVQGVIASIGGFGSYEQMKKINGDANIMVTEVTPELCVHTCVLCAFHHLCVNLSLFLFLPVCTQNVCMYEYMRINIFK